MRWLSDGSLVHLPARGVRISSSTDGVAVFLDLISFVNASLVVKEMCCRGQYDLVFTDDTPWRMVLLLLARTMGIPAIVSTHTDITHMKSFKGLVKVAWYVHMISAHLAAVHATVSRIFGSQLTRDYRVPVGGVWPPILWSSEFRSDPSEWAQEAAAVRAGWLEKLREQGCVPKAIMLYAGRWSAEKRIHLLFDAVPESCALVIVGDGTSEYADTVANAGPPSNRPNVLPLRKMLDGAELRKAYAASDLFLSASNFETLGNTIIEACCSGTPCAVQPAQGHLEFVKDGVNSWFVDYDDAVEVRSTLNRIVVSGLDTTSLQKSIPEFAALGSTLRNGKFAENLDEVLIQPAIEVGRQQCNGGALEYLKRCGAMIICILLWICLRVFTRLSFVALRDPEFEVLGPLGGADDDKNAPCILTYPCLRPFFGAKSNGNAKTNGSHPSNEAADATGSVGTDWCSHFESARKPWWNRRL
jgi:glycosyltransferase involved in cell wall biosynthesis